MSQIDYAKLVKHFLVFHLHGVCQLSHRSFIALLEQLDVIYALNVDRVVV